MEQNKVSYFFSMSEHVFAPIYEYLTQSVEKRIPISFHEIDVLDLGGGNGKWLFSLLKKGVKSGTLVDIEQEMVSFANKYFVENLDSDNWKAFQGSANEIPLLSESHNLIVSRSSMHMWDNLQQCWYEMYRVLKPGGFAFLGRGYGPDLPDKIRREVKVNRKKLREKTQDFKEEPPSPKPEDLTKIAQTAGFSEIEIIPDGRAYWILAKK